MRGHVHGLAGWGTALGMGPGGAPHLAWGRAQRRVTVYYFCVWDIEFGPGFIKICSYFPYPVKGLGQRPDADHLDRLIWPVGHDVLLARCPRSIPAGASHRSDPTDAVAHVSVRRRDRIFDPGWWSAATVGHGKIYPAAS
ncbi:MAG: hypothetical protein ACK5MT_11955 [Actinomycetales bacterium]